MKVFVYRVLLLLAAVAILHAEAAVFFEQFENGAEAWSVVTGGRETLSRECAFHSYSTGEWVLDASICNTTQWVAGSEKIVALQFDVAFRNGLNCGGGYVKLLLEEPPSPRGPRNVTDDGEGERLSSSRYGIMFGPDRCGTEKELLQFIIPFPDEDGNIVEHTLTSPPHLPPKAEVSHTYTLVLRSGPGFGEPHYDADSPMNSLLDVPIEGVNGRNLFAVFIDGVNVRNGSLQTEFYPSFGPPQFIPDVNDEIPLDWDDREIIPDPSAQKPADWDDNQYVSVPTGKCKDEPCPSIFVCSCEIAWKVIENPNYQGIWTPPPILNPNYSGVWAPRMVRNPRWHSSQIPDVLNLLEPIRTVALDIFTLEGGVAFDNILIATSIAEAENAREQHSNTLRQLYNLHVEEKESIVAQEPNQVVRYLLLAQEHVMITFVVVTTVTTIVFLRCCVEYDEDDTEEADEGD